jgi:hypothetical protein
LRSQSSPKITSYGAIGVVEKCSIVGTPCYDGVIVTCYNQVTDTGEKEKEKIFYYFFFYLEEDSFLPLEQRVELRIDLAGATTLWKNQDVT